MTYAAVIGDPIDHSLSPVLHRHAYATLGLDWDYRRIRVPAGELERLFGHWDPYCRALSVTMPHKRDVIAYLDHVDGLAKAVGAVNTVVTNQGLLVGFNTDVYGIVQAVREVRPAVSRCAIIGAGSTACSAMAAAVELGTRDIYVIARRFDGAHRVAPAEHRLGVQATHVPLRQPERVREVLATCDLVVSTLPGNAAGEIAADAPLGPHTVVLDVAYAAQAGGFERRCEQVGAAFVPGVRMLIHQAVLQIQVMTGKTVSADVLTEALAS